MTTIDEVIADLRNYDNEQSEAKAALAAQVEAANDAADEVRAQLETTKAEVATLTAKVAELQAELDELKPPPPPPPPPPPEVTTFRGTSFGNTVGPSKAGSARIYDSGDDQALKRAVDHGVTRIQLSSRDDTGSGSTIVSRIKSVFARYPEIKDIDYIGPNECDRIDHDGANSSTMAAWAVKIKNAGDAIYATTDWGTGRTVKNGVSMTGYGSVEGRSQQMCQLLKNNGAKVEVYASSMYPPGRNKTPAQKSTFDQFIRLSIDVAVQFGFKYVSCQEIGTPMSSAYDRPSYVATWFPEFVRYAKSKNIIPRDFNYWNGAKPAAGAPDNRFAADGTTETVVGKTEKAFFA